MSIGIGFRLGFRICDSLESSIGDCLFCSSSGGGLGSIGDCLCNRLVGGGLRISGGLVGGVLFS
jgi:hypothetical protein